MDAIARDRDALVASVRGLSPAQTDYRSDTARWSIDDVLHHLALTEEATVKLLHIFSERAVQEGIGPDPTPESSVLGSLQSKLAAADAVLVQAPERVTPRSKVEAGVALGRLESSRARVLTSLESLFAFDGSRLVHRHPFFGDLDLYQWLLAGGWHERRHTRQIERIKRDLPAFPT